MDGLGFTLWQVQHRLQLRLETRMAPLRLTLPQVATLIRLDDNPGMRSVDLARELLLTPQAVSLIIDKLGAAGYLARSGPRSGRSQPLKITAKGRQVRVKAESIIESVHEEIFGMLSVTERNSLADALGRSLAAVRERSD